jgi:hypothetical protein
MDERHSTAGVQSPALAQSDRRIAVELPPHAFTAGEEEIAARPELQPSPEWNGYLPADGPRLVVELASHAGADGDGSLQ